MTDFSSPGEVSAEESLALVAAQHAQATRSLRANPAPVLAAWGVAWLIGFGAFYLGSPKGPGPFVATWVAVLALVVSFGAALAVSVSHGLWQVRGIEGPSRTVRTMYAWAWPLAFATVFAVNLGLAHQGLPSRLAPLLWSSSALLVVGVLYLAGGIIWADRVQYGLGIWTLVTGPAGVSVGVPGNFAVLSLAGGGGLLVAASLAHARARRGRPTPARL